MIAATQISSEITANLATAVVAFAALVVFAGSLASLRGGRHVGTLLATYMGMGLELLVAATLIRLATVDTLEMLGLVAATITVRRTITLGLGYAARATG